MDLLFTRTGARCYAVTARRDDNPDLVCSPAPGFDERIPHDLVHLVAERRWVLRDGIYGALAGGGDAGTFLPADGHYDRRYARRTARRAPPGRDMARSEELAALLHVAWCRRHGLGERATLPAHGAVVPSAGELDGRTLGGRTLGDALDDLDAFARRWGALTVGETVTETWPWAERTTPAQRRRRERAG